MISLSTKHALRAILALKSHKGRSYVQIRDLSTLCGVPAPYLAKIVKVLAKSDILQTRKGLNGGVRLSSIRKKITLFDICQAIEDPVLARSCFMSKNPCSPNAYCPLHRHWSALRDQVIDFLKKEAL